MAHCGNIFGVRNSLRQPKLIAHRGHTGIAPENSLPAFIHAARLGVWAVETDVWATKDGTLVCCHNETTADMYGEDGRIPEMTLAEIACIRLQKGNNLEHYTVEDLRMPLFTQYLSVCRSYGNVPFVEIKGEVAGQVIDALRDFGMEEYAVISSSRFEHLEKARAASSHVFVHHIFSSEDRIAPLAEMGYAGMAFNITDLDRVPEGLIEKVHRSGVRMCLRAGDTRERVVRMIEIGLDYIPSNCIFSL